MKFESKDILVDQHYRFRNGEVWKVLRKIGRGLNRQVECERLGSATPLKRWFKVKVFARDVASHWPTIGHHAHAGSQGAEAFVKPNGDVFYRRPS